MIKKADIFLFLVILAFGLAVTWWSLSHNTDGQYVLVTVGGQPYGTYSLAENQEIDIIQDKHHNHITIKNGTVSMTFSDCKNQVCVNTGAISQTKDTIVCLPNQVMIEIQSDQGGDVDVVTG